MIAGFEPETLRSDRGNTFPAVMFHPWPIASTVFLTQELYWLSTVLRSRSRLGQPILVRLRSRPLSGGSATLVVHKVSAVVIIEGYVYCSIKSLLHPPPPADQMNRQGQDFKVWERDDYSFLRWYITRIMETHVLQAIQDNFQQINMF